MLELIDATKTYIQGHRTVQAVRGVSLTINSGEYVTIMGPSGSGKSTLMHLMGALDTPSGGRAVFQGQDLQSLTDRQRSLLRRDRIGWIVVSQLDWFLLNDKRERWTSDHLLAIDARLRAALPSAERVYLADAVRLDAFAAAKTPRLPSVGGVFAAYRLKLP